MVILSAVVDGEVTFRLRWIQKFSVADIFSLINPDLRHPDPVPHYEAVKRFSVIPTTLKCENLAIKLTGS